MMSSSLSLRTSFMRRARLLPAILLSMALAWFMPVPAAHADFVSINATANPITIPASGNGGVANPYPVTFNASGISGTISDFYIYMAMSATNNFVDDLDMLLVSPEGTAVLFLSDLPNAQISNTEVYIDDSYGAFPTGNLNTQTVLARPTNNNGGDSDTFSAPAPAAPYSSNFSAFNGQNPNGTWLLYINDDDGGAQFAASQISNVFLAITTPNLPTITLPAPQPSTNEDTDLPMSGTAAFSVSDPDASARVGCAFGSPVNGSLNVFLIVRENYTNLLLDIAGNLTFTPSANYSGAASFQITCGDFNDGTADFFPGTTTTATYNLTVNPVDDLPTITLPSPQPSTNEDSALSISGAAGFTVSDPDASARVGCRFGSPVNGWVNAFLLVRENYTDLLPDIAGSLTFTPVANYNGAASFTITCGDFDFFGGTDDFFPGTTSTATYNLTVNPVDDLPVITLPSPQPTTPENTDLPLFGAISGFTVTDVDAAARVRCLLNDAVNGLFVFEGPGDAEVTSISTEADSYASIISSYNGDNTRFRPTPGFNGTASFNITCGDADGLGFAAGTTASATYTLQVTSVNDAPTASNDSYSTAEDTPLTISAPGILANDTDPDGDALTAVLDLSTLSGTLALNADGSFSYTPNPNSTGTDSFTYRARDPGFASSSITTVAISVGATNDAPVVNAGADATPVQGGTFTLNATYTDNDFADTHSAVIDWGDGSPTGVQPVTGGSIAGSHIYSTPGNYTVTVTVTDNNGASGSDTALVSVSVNTPTPTPTGTPRPSSTPRPTGTPGVFPTPPETPLCVQRNAIGNDIVRAGGNDEFNDDIFCRTLVQNRNYVFYFTNPLTSAANVGDLGVLALGVQQAVDVFSPNATYWTGGFVMCLRGSGTMIYMRASGAPRVAEIVGTYTITDWPGFTCVTIFEPGTLVLANRQ